MTTSRKTPYQPCKALLIVYRSYADKEVARVKGLYGQKRIETLIAAHTSNLNKKQPIVNHIDPGRNDIGQFESTHG